MRVKRGNVNVKKHKKVLKLVKGFKGGQSKIFKAAMQAMMKALKKAYKGRKIKKRDFRGLWIQRIGAQAHEEDSSYSEVINGLNKAGVTLNRKMLSELAVNDKPAFAKVVKLAKESIARAA